MARIQSPVPGYNGLGPCGVRFADGVAETDNAAAIAYFERAGYGVDGDPAEVAELEPADPREVGTVQGNTLRDAAVDPRPTDFLPPTNAGEANPHGPQVVAPGLAGVVEALDDAEPQRPAKSATKDEWVAYAQHVDATAGVPEDHVDPASLSKAELVERYGK